MKFDIHVHTTLSACSQLRIEDILSHARRKGLDGVCITDNGTTGVRHLISEGLQPDGLCVIFGMEYSTPQGDFLICTPLNILPPNLSARELLLTVAENKGAAIAAHPFRKGHEATEFLIRENLCFLIENENRSLAESYGQMIRLWQKKYSVGVVQGSNAHSLPELGCQTTEFTVPIQTRRELINALNKGLFLAPELFNEFAKAS